MKRDGIFRYHYPRSSSSLFFIVVVQSVCCETLAVWHKTGQDRTG